MLSVTLGSSFLAGQRYGCNKQGSRKRQCSRLRKSSSSTAQSPTPSHYSPHPAVVGLHEAIHWSWSRSTVQLNPRIASHRIPSPSAPCWAALLPCCPTWLPGVSLSYPELPSRPCRQKATMPAPPWLFAIQPVSGGAALPALNSPHRSLDPQLAPADSP